MSSQIERDEPVASFEASRPKAAPLKKGATLTLGSKKKDSMTMQALREEGELAPAASCVHSPPRARLLALTLVQLINNIIAMILHPTSTPHSSLIPPPLCCSPPLTPPSLLHSASHPPEAGTSYPAPHPVKYCNTYPGPPPPNPRVPPIWMSAR